MAKLVLELYPDFKAHAFNHFTSLSPISSSFFLSSSSCHHPSDIPQGKGMIYLLERPWHPSFYAPHRFNLNILFLSPTTQLSPLTHFPTSPFLFWKMHIIRNNDALLIHFLKWTTQILSWVQLLFIQNHLIAKVGEKTGKIEVVLTAIRISAWEEKMWSFCNSVRALTSLLPISSPTLWSTQYSVYN